ncbi:MAG: DUF1573 domain-containing protein [Tannerella sp.]|jgi:hypothetical protein|nr:DUF1573 domain-containing protein [Tannerella sp.]
MMLKTTQACAVFLSVFFFLSQPVQSQENAKTAADPVPVATLVENTYDFGQINEADGFASHVFMVKNTGNAPLIITHVQSSCGCTEPQWTSEPIAPGNEGEVKITYDPVRRLGPFRKNVMIYTNDNTRRLRVTITGDVTPKPDDLQLVFHDTIGTVQVERADFLFYTVRSGTTATQEMWIQNFAEEDVTLSFENLPDYLKAEAPELLKSGKPERLKLTLDGAALDKRGRLLSRFTWKAVSASGATVTQVLPVAMNIIDNFATLTPEQKTNGPVIGLSNTLVEFGKLKKGGFLGLGNKRVSLPFTITNAGKSTLTLHSVGCDDERVQITGFDKKTLQPEESVTLHIVLRPKSVKETLVTDLYVIGNDPRGPVRQVRIIAER